MRAPDFPVSSDDCRVLLLLDETGSVKSAAEAIGRDVSVVTRQIIRLSRNAPVVEKIGGRWQVNEAGRRIAHWSRDAIVAQRRMLKSRPTLRIAATRLFSARILAPGLGDLRQVGNGPTELTVISSDQLEMTLLSGEADLAFACGRPRDPSIRFRRVLPEPFAIIAAPSLLGKRKITSLPELLELPHLQHTVVTPASALGLACDLVNVAAVFNDISSIRAAAMAGHGWAVVPRYAAEKEISDGLLREIRGPGIPVPEPEQYGVWWLRDRKPLEPVVEGCIAWLERQRL